MSGGGGGKKKNKNNGANNGPTYGNMPVVTTLDPFMGNNGQMLAQQLAMGYGAFPGAMTGGSQPGDPVPVQYPQMGGGLTGADGYLQQMMGFYRPMQNIALVEPLSETAAYLKDKKIKPNTGILALDRVLSNPASTEKGKK